MDDVRKIKVKDIKRQSKKVMVEDIVSHLKKKEKSGDLHNFVLPWYYNAKDFLNENEKMSDTWQKETAKDTEERISSLEKKMELSHNKFIVDLREWSVQLISRLPPPQGPRPYLATLTGTNPAMPWVSNGFTNQGMYVPNQKSHWPLITVPNNSAEARNGARPR